MSATIDLSKLKDPFAPDEIEWRVQQSGKKGEKAWALVLAYITNRAIMDRLDEVCGPENWRNEFSSAPNGGILCGLSIRINDEWVTKFDGADKTDIEATKGGLSNAMKRAGSQWGIGRYLYDLEASFVEVGSKGKNRIYDQKKGIQGNWDPPKLPGWALPEANAPGAMFVDLSKERQEQGRKRFFALAGDVFKGAPNVDELAYNFCEDILGFSVSKSRPSLSSSTAEQVREAIAALDKERLIIITKTGAKN